MEEKCLGLEGASDSYLARAFIGQGRMGSHSDVFVLQPKKKLLLHFTWSHPGRCPFCPLAYILSLLLCLLALGQALHSPRTY